MWRSVAPLPYRLALDHPRQVERLAVLDILSTADTWELADKRLATAFWPWSLLAQPEPLPERLLSAAPDAVIDDALGGWGSPANAFGSEVRAAYIEACGIPRVFMRSARSIAQRPLSTTSMIWRIAALGGG